MTTEPRYMIKTLRGALVLNAVLMTLFVIGAIYGARFEEDPLWPIERLRALFR